MRRVVLALAVLSGCSEPARVDVHVAVHDDPLVSPDDPAPPLFERALRLGRHALTGALAAGASAAPHAETGDADPGPLGAPTSDLQVQVLLEELRSAPMDELAVPANTLSVAQPEAWPAVREALLAPRSRSKTQYKSVLALIGGDVPNRYGHFARAWKRAHGYSVKLSEDWFADLLSLPTSRVSRGMRPVFRDSLATAALLRAAANIASTDRSLAPEVVEALLDAAYMHKGTFRDEVGRAIASIGAHSIAPLVAASAEPPRADEDDPAVKRAGYAVFNLDRIDRLHPAKALAAVGDEPDALAKLLQAYAKPRPGEAAALVLGYVDDPTLEVRTAARATFRAYVTGPLPRVKRRAIRQLGGKSFTKSNGVSYRARASAAIRARVEAEFPDQLEPECELRREDGTLDDGCVKQPARLTDAYLAALDQRRGDRVKIELEAAFAEPDPRTAGRRLDALLASGALDEDVAVLRRVAEFHERFALAHDDERQRARTRRKAAALWAQFDASRAAANVELARADESSMDALSPSARRILGGDDEVLSPEQPVRKGRFGFGLAAMALTLGSASTLGRWRRRR
jgi:hypothetical protein